MLVMGFADRFVAAIEQGDETTLSERLAPECTVNPSFSDGENDRTTTLRILRWMHRNVEGLRYDDIRRHAIDVGYVQQHLLRGTAPDGTELEIPACLVVTVHDDKITHIAEYLDSAHVRALMP